MTPDTGTLFGIVRSGDGPEVSTFTPRKRFTNHHVRVQRSFHISVDPERLLMLVSRMLRLAELC